MTGVAAGAPLTWVAVGVEGKLPTLGPQEKRVLVGAFRAVEGPVGGIAWRSCALGLVVRVVFAALFELRHSTADMGFLRVRLTHRPRSEESLRF